MSERTPPGSGRPSRRSKSVTFPPAAWDKEENVITGRDAPRRSVAMSTPAAGTCIHWSPRARSRTASTTSRSSAYERKKTDARSIPSGSGLSFATMTTSMRGDTWRTASRKLGWIVAGSATTIRDED